MSISIKALKKGVIIYKVMVYGGGIHSDKLTIVKEPHTAKFTDSLCLGVRDEDGFSDTIHLVDYNIPPNTYNSHGLFLTEEEQKQYIDTLVQEGYQL